MWIRMNKYCLNQLEDMMISHNHGKETEPQMVYGHISRSSGMAKTILQGTEKGARRRGRQKKRWEYNIKELTGMEFGDSLRAAENREGGKVLLQRHLWCSDYLRS